MATYQATPSAVAIEMGSVSPAEDKATTSAKIINLGGSLLGARAQGGSRLLVRRSAESSAHYRATSFACDLKLGGKPPAYGDAYPAVPFDARSASPKDHGETSASDRHRTTESTGITDMETGRGGPPPENAD